MLLFFRLLLNNFDNFLKTEIFSLVSSFFMERAGIPPRYKYSFEKPPLAEMISFSLHGFLEFLPLIAF